MTIEQAKKEYGIPMSDDWHKKGYVYCGNCPIQVGDDRLKYCPEDCSGYYDTYEAICDYMNDKAPTKITDTSGTIDTTNDIINHPSHYCREDGMESIDEMVLVFGKEAVMHFCLCNVWKYRYRSSSKNGDEDLKKSDWYMKKYRELCDE